MLRRFLFSLLILCSSPAMAQRLDATPGDTPPGSSVTYRDLLGMLFTGLEEKGAGFSGKPNPGLRHIAGPGEGDEAPEMAANISFTAVPVKAGRQDRLVVLIDIGSEGAMGYAIMALFAAGAAPKLLDAANVSYDRMTGFHEPGVIPAGNGETALVTTSGHFNSSQGYKISPIILIRNDRLELVDTVMMLDELVCTHGRVQTLTVATGAVYEPFADIVAAVTDTITPAEQGCGEGVTPPPASTRTLAVTYRWDAQQSKYLPDSDAFEALAKENEQRF